MAVEEQATTRAATLTLLLREGESSAASLASSMGISVQAMRRHLRSLKEDGLVKASLISQGPGRPFNLWQLTSQGIHQFNDGSEKFALDLFESLYANLSPEMMSRLLNQQVDSKAITYISKIGLGSLKDRLDKFVELRSTEGYMAEFQLSEDSASWYLNTFHCSISGIAEKYPVVCDQELQLIRNTFPDCNVQRVQWRLEYGHACGFQLTPIKKS